MPNDMANCYLRPLRGLLVFFEAFGGAFLASGEPGSQTQPTQPLVCSYGIPSARKRRAPESAMAMSLALACLLRIALRHLRALRFALSRQ